MSALEPIFHRAGASFAVVGHSYGGAVALLAALRRPERARALALYEPTLFALVDAEGPVPNADGIREAVVSASAALARGDRSAAAETFIDYWMGAGARQAKPETQRSAIEAAIVNVAGWGRTLFGETTPSARAVASLLAKTLPRVETLTFGGLGHMGPVTHPARVDEAIDDFLRRACPASDA